VQEGYRTGGMMRTFATVIKNEGFFALYKGLLPPLIGSGTRKLHATDAKAREIVDVCAN
jgi:hypothetical protein